MAKNLNIISHPVLQTKLAMLRDHKTTALSFRLIMEEMAELIAYEATRDLKLTNKTIETPLEQTACPMIGEEVVVLSIMRAGNGMLGGILNILPFARVGHIGIYRDRFIKSTVEYYLRLPKDLANKKVLVIDPLLATGDTACAALTRIKEYGVGPVRFCCLLASQAGVDQIHALYPDVEIFCAGIEPRMNNQGYLLPGVGDAGDRLYDSL